MEKSDTISKSERTGWDWTCARKRFASMLVLPIFWMATTAHAWTGSQIDLLDAYRMAEKRDPQLAAAREQRIAQLEQVPQARALLLPQVNAFANANRVWEDTRVDNDISTTGAFPIEIGDRSGNYNTGNIGINFRQALFRYEAFLSLRQARIFKDQAEVDFELARQQLGLQVADAYFRVLEAEDDVRSFEAELQAVDREMSRAQRRFELGVGGIIEVNDTQARHAATRANLLQSQSRLRLARETLSRTVNAPVASIAPLPPTFTPKTPQPDTPEIWVQLAERQSLEVQVAELSLSGLRTGVEIARSERYPQLYLIANIQRDYQGENPMFGGIGLESDTVSLGIQLSMPFYTGGGVTAGVRQSIAEREASFHLLDDARRSSALAAESAFIALESGLEQIAALTEALSAVQVAEESTQRGLELGQRTTLDLLNIQRERYQVERNLAAARYQHLLAYLQLRISIGESVDKVLEDVNRMFTNQ
jgi:outer membrane protein